MKNLLGIFASFLAVALLSVGLMAQPAGAARYDSAIQQKVTQELQDKKEFRGVQSSVEDGIVTLSGTVDLYQRIFPGLVDRADVRMIQVRSSAAFRAETFEG